MIILLSLIWRSRHIRLVIIVILGRIVSVSCLVHKVGSHFWGFSSWSLWNYASILSCWRTVERSHHIAIIFLQKLRISLLLIFLLHWWKCCHLRKSLRLLITALLLEWQLWNSFFIWLVLLLHKEVVIIVFGCRRYYHLLMRVCHNSQSCCSKIVIGAAFLMQITMIDTSGAMILVWICMNYAILMVIIHRCDNIILMIDRCNESIWWCDPVVFGVMILLHRV